MSGNGVLLLLLSPSKRFMSVDVDATAVGLSVSAP